MQQKDKLPLIGITMGDPSGIGPEIIVKALIDKEIYRICNPIIIGDKNIILSAADAIGLKDEVELESIQEPGQALLSDEKLQIINVSSINAYTPGVPSVVGGRAMVSYIEYAVNMAMKGRLDAMVTCPINKYLMHRAGFYFDGHTPFISHLTGTKDYVMMLAGERLRVSLVTIHHALRDVPGLITEEAVYKTIFITANALVTDFNIDSPRIAVAALNPHAGEDGLFGDEEEIIKMGIEKAKNALSSEIMISGPLPPDTVFYRAWKGEFDVVVSMYHDQGLIPLKLIHFSDAVNVTLGLPIIRTSVDHGTAYDIAGKGIADPSSLKAAIKIAARISKNRKSQR